MSDVKNEINGAQIVEIARRWIGTPYVHQTSLYGVGCDCLGLVRGVWRELYGSEPEVIPNYTSEWSEVRGREVLLGAANRHCKRSALNEKQAGDILLFRMHKKSPVKHMGILSSQSRFIHAYEGNNVVESPFNKFWQKTLVACFRFPNVKKISEGDPSWQQ